MSLYSLVRPLFADLDKGALEKVGAVAAQAYAAGPVSIGERVKTAMRLVARSPEAVDLLFSSLNYALRKTAGADRSAAVKLAAMVAAAAREIDAEYEKTAAQQRAPQHQSQSAMMPGGPLPTPKPSMPTADKVQTALGLASLAISAAPFLAGALRRRKRERAVDSAHRRVMQEHPELRGDPHVQDYYATMADFAPDVAANPLLAGNILKNIHRIGPEGFTGAQLKELLELQRLRTEQRGKADDVKGVATALGQVRWPRAAS